LTSKSTGASRRGWCRSTGPRSAAGKDRSAQNARRHGFAAARPLEGRAGKEIEDLARKLAGDAGEPERLYYARKAAEMQMMLHCICAARINLINAHLPKQEVVGLADSGQPTGTVASGLAQGDRYQQGSPCMAGSEEVDALLQVLPELLRLERYESAALAGRRRALLQLARCRYQSAQRVAQCQSS